MTTYGGVHTISNQLSPKAFVHSRRIQINRWVSPHIDLSPTTSPNIKYEALKPARTPSSRKYNSITVLSIPRDTEIEGWRLKLVTLVRVYPRRKESVAMTWLEGAAEYGVGMNESEAITDLVVSLGEYREALEKQENKLGVSTQKELNCLRNLIERAPGKFI